MGLWALAGTALAAATRKNASFTFWAPFAFVAAATAAFATDHWMAALVLVALCGAVLFLTQGLVRWLAVVPALLALWRTTEILTQDLPGAWGGYVGPVGVLFVGGFLALWGWREEVAPARRVAWLALALFGVVALAIGVRDVIHTADTAAVLLMVISMLTVASAGWGLWQHRNRTGGPEPV